MLKAFGQVFLTESKQHSLDLDIRFLYLVILYRLVYFYQSLKLVGFHAQVHTPNAHFLFSFMYLE